MDKELFDYLSDLKIENIKLKKQMDGFTDKGTNKYLERKVDILTDALNAIERLKIPLLSPQINELLQNAARELDKLYAEYKKMEEL